MFFISSISNGKKDLDYSKMIICPNCSAYGRLEIFYSYRSLSIFFIPVFKWKRRYYARTSCCQAIFSLDEELARQVEREPDMDLDPGQLRLLESGNLEPRCKSCGRQVAMAYGYCPYCGRRME